MTILIVGIGDSYVYFWSVADLQMWCSWSILLSSIIFCRLTMPSNAMCYVCMYVRLSHILKITYLLTYLVIVIPSEDSYLKFEEKRMTLRD